MAKKEWISWSDSFSVGISLIDDQHKQLVAMTNLLYNACNHNDRTAASQFQITMRDAVTYVKYHFATEEQLMVKVNYPAYKEHKKEHGEFIQEILTEIKNFKEGKKFVPDLFVRFLRDWVLSHIAKTDSQLGLYLQRLQKEGKVGRITVTSKASKTPAEG